MMVLKLRDSDAGFFFFFIKVTSFWMFLRLEENRHLSCLCFISIYFIFY